MRFGGKTIPCHYCVMTDLVGNEGLFQPSCRCVSCRKWHPIRRHHNTGGLRYMSVTARVVLWQPPQLLFLPQHAPMPLNCHLTGFSY